ncbi:MAG: hypothetical protein Q8O72_15225 [Bacteroidales bacterium]|jgi:hypothetical protein|nr:hypothetical protein [Bacteroidales bacterium]
MKKKSDKLNLHDSQTDKKDKNTLQGDPIYPDGDFIYEKIQEEEDKNPEDPSRVKEPNNNYALAPISFTQFLKSSPDERE